MSNRRSEMESQMNDAGNSQNATASNANANAFIASLLRQYQAMAQSSANQLFASQLSVAA